MATKFAAFCENTEKSKSTAIQDGKDQAEQLAASMQKSTSDAKVLGEEIMKLGASVDAATKDKADAIETRKSELADYKKTHAEYVENIADLQAALGKIKEMMAKAPGASAASLLQQISQEPMMSSHTKRYISAFVQERSGEDYAIAEGLDSSAPEAAAFETQSGVARHHRLLRHLLQEACCRRTWRLRHHLLNLAQGCLKVSNVLCVFCMGLFVVSKLRFPGLDCTGLV